MSAPKKSAKAEIQAKIQKENKVIDVEIPKDLAGLVFYGQEEFRYWTPEPFKMAYPKDKSKWPLFKIRNYNADDESLIIQKIIESNIDVKDVGRYFMTSPEAARLLVKRCLKDVKNLKDVNGKDVELKLVKNEVPDDILARIPFRLMNMLQTTIMAGAEPTEEETTSLGF